MILQVAGDPHYKNVWGAVARMGKGGVMVSLKSSTPFSLISHCCSAMIVERFGQHKCWDCNARASHPTSYSDFTGLAAMLEPFGEDGDWWANPLAGFLEAHDLSEKFERLHRRLRLWSATRALDDTERLRNFTSALSALAPELGWAFDDEPVTLGPDFQPLMPMVNA